MKAALPPVPSRGSGRARPRLAGLFGGAFRGIHHKGFVVPAPVKDVENEDRFFLFVHDESGNRFFVDGDNPQVVHEVVPLLSPKGRGFQFAAFLAELVNVAPGPFRKAALVRDVAIDALKVFDGIGHQVNIIFFHPLLHPLPV